MGDQSEMFLNKSHAAIAQKRALMGGRELSSTPYYIQRLEIQLESVEWKLDKVLELLQAPKGEED